MSCTTSKSKKYFYFSFFSNFIHFPLKLLDHQHKNIKRKGKLKHEHEYEENRKFLWEL